MRNISPELNQAGKVVDGSRSVVSVGLLADFNVQNLSSLLEKNAERYSLKCVQGPFGQTLSVLLNPRAGFWSVSHDAVVLWTVPEQAVPSFKKAIACETYDTNELLGQVDAFADVIDKIPTTVPWIIIPSWVIPSTATGRGPLEFVDGVGITNALMRMNLALAERLSQNRRVVFLNAQPWIGSAGAGAYNAKLWYLSKTPFHTDVFREASKDILAVLDGTRGYTKKIVIVDLDNTLWGGVVGDVGWERLRLGGHDPIGEAYVDFQKGLKRLINRGVVLAIVSKNEELTAMGAIQRHPEMVLKRDDFVGWRLNWSDKAQNILDLLNETRLGADAAVFLDDSPFERARVREALPQVLVPEMPGDVLEYPRFLERLRCFDKLFVSSEDRKRTEMYVADRSRIEFKNEIGCLADWLAKLEISMIVEPLNRANLDRAAQLFNKTNQMNLSTRRLTASELFLWSQEKDRGMWAFRVLDKFGDYGLCGIGSLARKETAGQIVDFLMSCRVMGRGVEEAILAFLVEEARRLGCQTVHADFVPTTKNEPCRKWLQSLVGVEMRGDRYLLKNVMPYPSHIKMQLPDRLVEKSLA